MLEQKIQALRKLGDKLTKNQIKEIGDPALNRLKSLKIMKVDEVFAINPSLEKRRDYIFHLIKQRNICMERLVITENDVSGFGMNDLTYYEKITSTSVLGPPREYMQILEMNDRMSKQVDSSEAAAVRNLNEYRILIGLRPCIIDPKLCLSSREHSEDMERKGFFAHESPVKGKKLLGTELNWQAQPPTLKTFIKEVKMVNQLIKLGGTVQAITSTCLIQRLEGLEWDCLVSIGRKCLVHRAELIQKDLNSD